MKKGILKVTLLFLFLFSLSSAEFSLPLILKYPFTNRVYLDTLTNEMVYDSLARNIRMNVILWRINYEDSLLFEVVTNDSGVVVIDIIISWHDAIPVDTNNILKLSIEFPNAEIVHDGGAWFEPAKIDSVHFLPPEGMEYIQ